MIKIEIDWKIKLSIEKRLAEIGLYWPPVTLDAPRGIANKSPRGVFYSFVSRTLGALAFLLLWFVTSIPRGKPGGLILLLVILCACLFISYWALWFADQSERWSPQVNNDPRPPIVCLRSFRDDFRDSWNDSRWFVNPINLIQRRIRALNPKNRFGFQLKTILSFYGPLVTLKSPDHNLPLLGPREIRVGDEDWREELLSQIDRAALILVFAGVSAGLFWELNEIALRGLLRRTVLIVPPYFGQHEVETVRALVDLAKHSAPLTAVPKHLEMNVDSLPLVEALIHREGFREFGEIPVDQVLLLRWANNGEPIVFTKMSRTGQSILDAIGVCVQLSTDRRFSHTDQSVNEIKV